MMRRILLLGVAAGLALAALIGMTVYFFDRPTYLRVAVERDSQEEAVMAAAAQKLGHDHAGIRFRLHVVDDLTEAAHALEQGHDDLAVVRSDVSMPSNGGSVLVMHPNVALFIAPAGSNLRTITEMKGHRIGVLRDTANLRGAARPGLLEAIFSQYDVPLSSITTVPVARDEISRVIEDKSVDAILAVGVPESGPLADVVAAVTAAGDGEPVFIPVAEAKAISDRLPYFESSELVRGVFHGVKPAKTVETLAVSTRLVARTSLADDTAAAVTRLMLAARPELALRVPAANRIEAPSTTRMRPCPSIRGRPPISTTRKRRFSTSTATRSISVPSASVRSARWPRRWRAASRSIAPHRRIWWCGGLSKSSRRRARPMPPRSRRSKARLTSSSPRRSRRRPCG